MIRSLARFRALALLVAALVATGALVACGSDAATGSADQPDALTCPPATAPRPDDGWLGEGSVTAPVVPGLELTIDSPEADALAAAALAEVGGRFTVSDRSVVESPECPDRQPVLRVELALPDGGRVTVVNERLTGQLYWSEEPVAGELVRSTLPDGTEVAVNDFNGEGVYRRAWVARPDGTMVKVSAVGSNAPSQAGWPTTMATVPPTGSVTLPAPTAAPLTMSEVQALAVALLPA